MRSQPYFKRKIISYICVTVVLLMCGAVAVYRAAHREVTPQPSAPGIRLTRIPPPGGGPDRMETIAGVVSNVNVKECGCKVVIFSLGDVWYVQPFVNAPFTDLTEDGRFETRIHLGSKYAVLLVKSSYQPPAKADSLPAVGGDVLASVTVDAVAEKPGGGHQDKHSNYTRVIQFSGYEWKVKTSASQVGPGPNYFSDSDKNVEVDSAGRLHLRITHRDGQWQCAEVILTRSLGYGVYRFYLDTEPKKIADTVYAVLGAFTWSDVSAEFHHREIDFELSAWGTPPQQGAQNNKLGQFVIQPWSTPENIVRFHLPPRLSAMTHAFTWRPESVFCQSLQGHTARAAGRKQVIYEHTFTRNIPPAAEGTHARINLWLMAGRPPANGEELEVVISKFEYAPLR